jgi:hypothetical protein
VGELPVTEQPKRVVRRPARPAGERPGSARREDPVLPDVPPDETDERWGDEPRERSDEWYRRERPPHHGD